MTTIAYKDGILAGDTRVTSSYTNVLNVMKIASRMFNAETQLIAAVSGDLATLSNVRKWISSADTAANVLDTAPTLLNDSDEVLLIEHDLVNKVTRVYILYKDGSPVLIQPRNGIIAIGSGKEVALGAMSAGATAKEAVEIASIWDKSTGDATTVLYCPYLKEDS